ncbi:hypothetical protein FFLO_05717 [Filobasidium floriforme]|uniref:Glycolipid transfer protein domain-containing protein n=1 Tax=Filobasidium floriforme TaxID=5210 RepID=A0A8K0JGD2_9TREE|nr:glycolipid transfer protein domain-containing protein [Filobasidium floriforme]KAG7529365.1 hypothetical protein FFLO_05717 [Filobasidium floriforme]KAH8087318.1 glycolipid transfer protein domain-containing protein [Filobasidium floriforme]
MADVQPAAQEAPVPFYKTVKRSFKDVSLDPGVNTDEFCEATDAVVAFFDLFNNKAFQVVQNDLSTKNAKVRERRKMHPETSVTLEDILRNEKESGDMFATGALTWLLRGLRFTSLGLRENMNNEKEELSTSMSRAYDQSLRPFHGFMIRPLFKLAMNVCPYRAKFYPSLGEPTDVVMAELDDWLAGLERILQQMSAYYKSGNYGSIGM